MSQPDPTAAEVLTAYLSAQATGILGLTDAVRDDEPDAVHQMRVSSRRLRSALATFRPVLHRRTTEPLRSELRWLGSVLGPARDAEVLRERFAQSTPEPLATTVDRLLERMHDDATLRVRAAVSGPAYESLCRRLDSLVAEPPLRRRAAKPAAEVLAPRVHRSGAQVARQAAAADDDVLLHEVRKAAKRARYAADACVPLGKRYSRMSDAMSELQSVLGEHQDSVVARDLLRSHPLLMSAVVADQSSTARADAPDATGAGPGDGSAPTGDEDAVSQAAALAAQEEASAEVTLRSYAPALVKALAAVPGAV